MPESVFVVGSGNSALDQHVLRLLGGELGEAFTFDPLPESQISASGDTPIITIGSAAFSRVRQENRSAIVLALLVERSFIESYAERSEGRVGAVYQDVPLLRQALTGKAILQQATRIALLANTDSAELYEPLVDQLASYDLNARIFIADSEDQLIPALIRALSYGDFLLAAPDEAIYNPRSIKHILLTAYRRNKILIGPSQAYVRAGALASSYAPFDAMAEQAATLLNHFIDRGEFPPPTYSPRFKVVVNQQVARSLNIPLPDRDWIAETVDAYLDNQQEGQE
ncbi:MAG: ABC transporter substrate-binding protein [Marinobacter sp. 34-60-7]|nr:MAG: ABC transporter substrate-binding protein [Marinobacter sp. 34-60-7]